MNPLPVIRRWLDCFDSHTGTDMTRSDLLAWVAREFPNLPSDLTVDCLIVAGIGRDSEQSGTVYCRAEFGGTA